MFIAISYAMGAQPAGNGGDGSAFLGFIPVVVMFAIFYFLLIRPQQKKQKDRQDMIDHLKRGDNIVTQGGIYGSVSKIKDDVVTVQVADQVSIKLARSAVSSLREK